MLYFYHLHKNYVFHLYYKTLDFVNLFAKVLPKMTGLPTISEVTIHLSYIIIIFYLQIKKYKVTSYTIYFMIWKQGRATFAADIDKIKVSGGIEAVESIDAGDGCTTTIKITGKGLLGFILMFEKEND